MKVDPLENMLKSIEEYEANPEAHIELLSMSAQEFVLKYSGSSPDAPVPITSE